MTIRGYRRPDGKVGAERIMGDRCATSELRDRLLKTISDYEARIRAVAGGSTDSWRRR